MPKLEAVVVMKRKRWRYADSVGLQVVFGIQLETSEVEVTLGGGGGKN